MWTSQSSLASVPVLVLLSVALLVVLQQESKAAMAQEQCGSQAGFALCGNALCCSQFGFCGSTSDYCCQGCQSQCQSDQCGSSGCSSGQASFYTAPYVPSACFGNDPDQFSQYFAAAGDGNPDIWQNGANCGKFFSITCEGNGCRGAGTISVKIVDRCPNGCVGGRAFDLSEETFNAIADPSVGVITVNYCPQ